MLKVLLYGNSCTKDCFKCKETTDYGDITLLWLLDLSVAFDMVICNILIDHLHMA